MTEALAATGNDLAFGFGVVLIAAAITWGFHKWFTGSRYYEAERVRPEPVCPIDFEGEIRAYKNSRDDREWAETGYTGIRRERLPETDRRVA